MPFLAGLAPILTAVAAAGTLAATGYELANQPGSGSSPDAMKAVQAQQAKDQATLQQQQKAAFTANEPNIQSQTSGSLTPTAFGAQTATTAGVPSDLNSIARYLGLGTGTANAAPITGGFGATTGQQNNNQNLDLQTLSDLLRTA